MMDVRPGDKAAKHCQENQISRVNEPPCDNWHYPHPSHDGTRGYLILFYQKVVSDYLQGQPVLPSLVQSTIRWITQMLPYRITGNVPNCSLVGKLILVLYKLVWPQAMYFECIVAISRYSRDTKIFSKWTICNNLRGLWCTHKVSPTAAYQAFTPRSILYHNLFWNRPCLVGIRGERHCRLVDADEFGVHLNDTNKKMCFSTKRTEGAKAMQLWQEHFQVHCHTRHWGQWPYCIRLIGRFYWAPQYLVQNTQHWRNVGHSI